MANKDAVLMSRDNDRVQLTGNRALLLSQRALDQGRYPDAERLLTIAHDLFTTELLTDYVPNAVAEP